MLLPKLVQSPHETPIRVAKLILRRKEPIRLIFTIGLAFLSPFQALGIKTMNDTCVLFKQRYILHMLDWLFVEQTAVQMEGFFGFRFALFFVIFAL